MTRNQLKFDGRVTTWSLLSANLKFPFTGERVIKKNKNKSRHNLNLTTPHSPGSFPSLITCRCFTTETKHLQMQSPSSYKELQRRTGRRGVISCGAKPGRGSGCPWPVAWRRGISGPFPSLEKDLSQVTTAKAWLFPWKPCASLCWKF